ncbi:MAG TPA: hypothetical protein VGR74_11005 [Actinomycetota bacterium]|nr:hypothetical protein [Actinomycetota bacterium]
MGSSGGSSDFEEPPRGPNPPAGSIIPQGGSAPLKSNFINFLGDTNTPSTGLTPEMLDAIMATQSPSPGPPGMGMGGPPAAAAAAPPPASREKLAQVMSGRGEGGSRGGRGAGSGGNSGGWGGH